MPGKVLDADVHVRDVLLDEDHPEVIVHFQIDGGPCVEISKDGTARVYSPSKLLREFKLLEESK